MNRWPVALIVLALAAPQAPAKDVGACKLNIALRQMVDDMNRIMKACMTIADYISECGRFGIDVKAFDNAEGRLPRIRKDEGAVYIEGKVRQSDGSPGTWRIVDRFQIAGERHKFLQGYYTDGRYATFCGL
jgi:guanyl-specific ribonuclease Sa